MTASPPRESILDRITRENGNYLSPSRRQHVSAEEGGAAPGPYRDQRSWRAMAGVRVESMTPQSREQNLGTTIPPNDGRTGGAVRGKRTTAYLKQAAGDYGVALPPVHQTKNPRISSKSLPKRPASRSDRLPRRRPKEKGKRSLVTFRPVELAAIQRIQERERTPPASPIVSPAIPPESASSSSEDHDTAASVAQLPATPTPVLGSYRIVGSSSWVVRAVLENVGFQPEREAAQRQAQEERHQSSREPSGIARRFGRAKPQFKASIPSQPKEAVPREPSHGRWSVLWTATHLRSYVFQGLAPHQRVNQFPRSTEMSRKDALARNVIRMQQLFGKRAFDFIPRTFVLPRDMPEFEVACKARPNRPWILKPVGSSQGRGVRVRRFGSNARPLKEPAALPSSSSFPPSSASSAAGGAAKQRLRLQPVPPAKDELPLDDLMVPECAFHVHSEGTTPSSVPADGTAASKEETTQSNEDEDADIQLREDQRPRVPSLPLSATARGSSRRRGRVVDVAHRRPGTTPANPKPRGRTASRKRRRRGPSREHKAAANGEVSIVSEYMERPLLLGGRKFDLRLYVCVTSFHPLRVYIHEEGLVRFATKPFTLDAHTFQDRYVHLTNYSVNKHHASFVPGGEGTGEGQKWSLETLFRRLSQEKGDECVTRMRSAVNDLVVKTLLAVEDPIAAATELSVPEAACNLGSLKTTNHQGSSADLSSGSTLQPYGTAGSAESALEADPSHGAAKKRRSRKKQAKQKRKRSSSGDPAENAGMCFQLFGFDVLMDEDLRPWLLEVNFAPSLSVDSALDLRVKTQVIADTFNLACVPGPYEDRSSAPRPAPEAEEDGSSKPDLVEEDESGCAVLPRTDGSMPSPADGVPRVVLGALFPDATTAQLRTVELALEERKRAGGFRCLFPTEDARGVAEYVKYISPGPRRDASEALGAMLLRLAEYELKMEHAQAMAAEESSETHVTEAPSQDPPAVGDVGTRMAARMARRRDTNRRESGAISRADAAYRVLCNHAAQCWGKEKWDGEPLLPPSTVAAILHSQRRYWRRCNRSRQHAVTPPTGGTMA